MKKISKETELKILKYAIAIIQEHGSVSGDRCCQDWSIDESEILPPEIGFNKGEMEDISFNYQQENSNGEDYDPNFMGFGDEMMVSFMIANALKNIVAGR